MSVTRLLNKIVERKDLGADEAEALMRALIDPATDRAVAGGALIGLRLRGVRPVELAAFARVLRERALGLRSSARNLVDTCGTGGGRATWNLSTGAAIVAAAAGTKVAKHGNRAISSACGSADVLEALGARLFGDLERLRMVLEETGIVFLFAPNHHPALKEIGPVRKALGVRTVFNQLGPLLNPAGAKRQLVGVYEAALVEPMAEALRLLGTHRAIVAHSEDGLDEISPCAPTRVAELGGEYVLDRTLLPEHFGQEPLPEGAIEPGATVAENAAILREALSQPGSPRSAALVPGAATAIYLGEGAEDLKAAAALARAAIASGAARRKLEELVAATVGE
jgi:anthranilate phosphoribosyltransferase